MTISEPYDSLFNDCAFGIVSFTGERILNWNLILTVTFAGIIIVFASLIMLSVFVFLYPKALRGLRKKNVKSNDESGIIEQFPEEEPGTDDNVIAAVIAAAVAAYGETSYPPRIIIREIKKNVRPLSVWNAAGRFESLN